MSKLAKTADAIENASGPVRLQEARPHTLKYGNTFALFAQNGDCTPGDCSAEGIFHQDTRFLSSRQLWINGHPPLLLASSRSDHNMLLNVDMTNPTLATTSGEIHKDSIHITRTIFLWEGACYERINIHNYDDREHTLSLEMDFDSDFVDLFEVRGAKRPRRGTLQRRATKDGISLGYQGLDELYRYCHIACTPVPNNISEQNVSYTMTLRPGAHFSVYLMMRCLVSERAIVQHEPFNTRYQFYTSLRKYYRWQRRLTAPAASVSSSNNLFNEVLGCSMADITMLTTTTDTGLYPYAGIPWYSTVFGRDGILTALQMLWVNPDLAKGVLHFLAANQATGMDAFADAEPGKILHEIREGEMARLREVPFLRYYGSVDSTPLFLLLAARYFFRTRDYETMYKLWPHIEAAFNWIDQFGDIDGDGFVEYQRAQESGLRNQCWKDSHDSVFHADGTLAEGPVAVCEVQGYVYAAKREIAEVARILGQPAYAEKLEEQADALYKAFHEAFWDEELGSFILALDGKKRPCRVRSSNAGHILFSGLATPEQARRVCDQLMSPSFYNGWGIRTIASTEARYNPVSYHNGTVWPHDNAIIAAGFAKYGEVGACQKLLTGCYETALRMEHRRLPELFCGFPRRSNRSPISYPVACAPQAWAAAAPFGMLAACLGLEFNAGREEIKLNHPALPAFINELFLRNVSVGSTSADIQIHRYGSKVSVNVQNKTGDGQVLISL